MFAVGAARMPPTTAVVGIDLEQRAPHDTLCAEPKVAASIAAESASAKMLDAPAESSRPGRLGVCVPTCDEVRLRPSVHPVAHAWAV